MTIDELDDIFMHGYWHYYGKEGYPLDHNKAMEYFLKAAKYGDSQAMDFLGSIYEAGEVTEKNYEIAADWYKKSFTMSKTNARAAYNLGRMYYNGTGVTKDLDKAYEYIETSVRLGIRNRYPFYPHACYLTGNLLLNHYNNIKKCFPYFWEAAHYGDIAEAWYYLGYLLERDIPPTLKGTENEAVEKKRLLKEYYEKSALKGYEPAIEQLKQFNIQND